ncbi:uncharacterized protein CLUP02_17721 [Colletotrichum lupini]|uniref:Uncharacterized protein n=1 Tax=Colletotrichum lupini TaxID=145971 RepID=A0A9Q8WA21_9PEZI|nr:uncharacterized protein CLUP02_17721 [Colletotrichum lupini]UQC76208.1 hypothetical protein CLUP02_17721 [Colletotrichum lupini]
MEGEKNEGGAERSWRTCLEMQSIGTESRQTGQAWGGTRKRHISETHTLANTDHRGQPTGYTRIVKGQTMVLYTVYLRPPTRYLRGTAADLSISETNQRRDRVLHVCYARRVSRCYLSLGSLYSSGGVAAMDDGAEIFRRAEDEEDFLPCWQYPKMLVPPDAFVWPIGAFFVFDAFFVLDHEYPGPYANSIAAVHLTDQLSLASCQLLPATSPKHERHRGTAAETHHLGHESSEAIQVPPAARSNAPSRSDLLHISISWIINGSFHLDPLSGETPPAISGVGHRFVLWFDKWPVQGGRQNISQLPKLPNRVTLQNVAGQVTQIYKSSFWFSKQVKMSPSADNLKSQYRIGGCGFQIKRTLLHHLHLIPTYHQSVGTQQLALESIVTT